VGHPEQWWFEQQILFEDDSKKGRDNSKRGRDNSKRGRDNSKREASATAKAA